MMKVIDGFGSEPFMEGAVSEETQKRYNLFDKMAPDLQRALAEGSLPAYVVEKLARKDMEP